MAFFFSIKDLEQYSGVKAHTIRIWEKRYNLLNPDRTETNIRLYTSEQLKKLINIVTLLNYGWKISKVSALNDEQISLEMEKWVDEFSDEYTAQINSLISFMISFSQTEFEALFDNCVKAIGFRNTVTKIMYPFLGKVGHFWQTNKITPAHEHFASNLIKRKLNAAINELPIPDNNKPKFLLFLSENEHHDLGLLLAQYMLRKNGNPVLYLGTNLPSKNLMESIDYWNPQYILTFVIAKKTTKAVSKLLTAIENKGINQCLICGLESILSKVEFTDRTIWLRSPEMLANYLH